MKIGSAAIGNGVVVLTGHSAHQPAVDKAVAIARSVMGVTAIENNIAIKADK